MPRARKPTSRARQVGTLPALSPCHSAPFSHVQSQQYANDFPPCDDCGHVPSGWSVEWKEMQAQICYAKLWPQTRLMPSIMKQLLRLSTHPEVRRSHRKADWLAYSPPAAATTHEAVTAFACAIHRLFRYLEAEHHHLDVRLPKAEDVRRNFLVIEVRPQLLRKPVASQLKKLERAARTGNRLVWEAAWRGTTMPALRVLDQARAEAVADKRDPLRVRVDFWREGQILSSMIPTAEFVTKLLPIAQRIAAEPGNPGRQPEYATIKSLCAVFRTVTGRDADAAKALDGTVKKRRAELAAMAKRSIRSRSS